jgi:hypothetical protein
VVAAGALATFRHYDELVGGLRAAASERKELARTIDELLAE